MIKKRQKRNLFLKSNLCPIQIRKTKLSRHVMTLNGGFHDYNLSLSFKDTYGLLIRSSTDKKGPKCVKQRIKIFFAFVERSCHFLFPFKKKRWPLLCHVRVLIYDCGNFNLLCHSFFDNLVSTNKPLLLHKIAS